MKLLRQLTISDVIKLVIAAITTLLVVAQLFTFEKYADVIEALGILPGFIAPAFFAAGIVTVEIIALPYLLFISLSKPIATTSMLANWMMTLKWLYIIAFLLITNRLTENTGLLGATITVHASWGILLIAIVYAVLVGWVAKERLSTAK